MISPIFVITVFCYITVSSSFVVVVVFWSIMIVATFGFHLVHYPCSSGSRIGDVLTSLERSDEGVPNVLAAATDGSAAAASSRPRRLARPAHRAPARRSI